MSEHCVKLRFPFADDDLQIIYDFEDALSDAISVANAGEFDGNDVGQGECILYMYEADADALFEAIKPVVRNHADLVAGGRAILRYGPPEPHIREVTLPIPPA